jgi:hypothetical protein
VLFGCEAINVEVDFHGEKRPPKLLLRGDEAGVPSAGTSLAGGFEQWSMWRHMRSRSISTDAARGFSENSRNQKGNILRRLSDFLMATSWAASVL